MAAKAKLRFLGVAAYEIVNSKGQHILIDPYLDSAPVCPVPYKDLERVDLIIVSHAAIDHFGDTEAIARHFNAPVICGGEIKNYLLQKGMPSEQIQATTWGIRVEVNGIEVQPVECHHWSQMKMPDGTFASGVPMGFVVYVDEGIRFYHYGDTAIFSDLKLIRDLYKPTIGCVGITQPVEVLHLISGPGKILTGEMSPREGLMAAQWLGLDTVLPCHYFNEDCDDVHEFQQLYQRAKEKGEWVPRKSVVMKQGEWMDLESIID